MLFDRCFDRCNLIGVLICDLIGALISDLIGDFIGDSRGAT